MAVSATRPCPPGRGPFTLGLRPGVDIDKALRLSADLEDAEIVRELKLRK